MTSTEEQDMGETFQLDPDGQWRRAVPLPWYVLFGVKCGDCKMRWVGRRAKVMARYRVHWRIEHGDG